MASSSVISGSIHESPWGATTSPRRGAAATAVTDRSSQTTRNKSTTITATARTGTGTTTTVVADQQDGKDDLFGGRDGTTTTATAAAVATTKMGEGNPFIHQNHNTSNPQQQQQQDENDDDEEENIRQYVSDWDECSMKSLRWLHRVLLTLDGLIGLTLLLYASYWIHHELNNQNNDSRDHRPDDDGSKNQTQNDTLIMNRMDSNVFGSNNNNNDTMESFHSGMWTQQQRENDTTVMLLVLSLLLVQGSFLTLRALVGGLAVKTLSFLNEQQQQQQSLPHVSVVITSTAAAASTYSDSAVERITAYACLPFCGLRLATWICRGLALVHSITCLVFVLYRPFLSHFFKIHSNLPQNNNNNNNSTFDDYNNNSDLQPLANMVTGTDTDPAHELLLSRSLFPSASHHLAWQQSLCSFLYRHYIPHVLLFWALAALVEAWPRYRLQRFLFLAYRLRLTVYEEEDLMQTRRRAAATTANRPWWWTDHSPRRQQQQPWRLSSGNNNNNGLMDSLLLHEEEQENDDDNHGARRRGRTRGIPQWVTSGNHHHQDHHDVTFHDERDFSTATTTAGETKKKWSWSLWPFSSSSNANHDGNVRDDGSVDFASVQEEWASRSEEDPYWWTREDEHPESQNNTGRRGATFSTSSTASHARDAIDTSWVTDRTHL